MLKFGASQHFQEVSHEPPGTERGEKFVGDEGDGCRGCAPVFACVRRASEMRRCRVGAVCVCEGGGGWMRL